MADQPTQSDYKAHLEAMNNAGYQATSALQIRLDMTPFIDHIEKYLSGRYEVLFDSDGNGTPDLRKIETGEPLVNPLGKQMIMMWVRSIFNTALAQGNFPDTKKKDGYTMYCEYLSRARWDLSSDLMKNSKRFALAEDNYDILIDTLMRFVEVFMTRPLYNKERESYANTIKSVENLQTQPRRNFMGLPF